jgi:hypothetical protein
MCFGKYTLGDGFYFLNGIEGIRMELLDDAYDMVQVLSLDDRKDHFYLPGPTFPIDTGYPVILRTEVFCEFQGVFFGNDADTGEPKRYFFLDKHANERSGSKPGSVRDIRNDICEVVHHLPDGKQPDDHFEKPDEGSEILDPLGYEDHPDSAKAHIADPGTEDHEWQDYIGNNFRGQDQVGHSCFIFFDRGC